MIFFLLARQRVAFCWNWLVVFQAVCLELGIPLAKEKTEEPVPILSFLGIEIDTINMIFLLPEDKLSCLQSLFKLAISLKKLK